MSASTIEATNTKTGEKAAFDFDFGETVEEAIEKFGGPVVLSGFIRTSVIAAQNTMRSAMKAGSTPEEAAAKMENWKPGIVSPRSRKDPKEAFKALFDAASPEEKKAMLAALQG